MLRQLLSIFQINEEDEDFSIYLDDSDYDDEQGELLSENHSPKY
ncbi:hypothetical protein [Niallia nealsonii]|nr:hypothetical protein [Niallia nealsonii]